MKRGDWLDAALKVLGASVGLFGFSLVIRVVSDDLGLLFLYGAGLAAIAGGVCLALVFLVSRAG